MSTFLSLTRNQAHERKRKRMRMLRILLTAVTASMLTGGAVADTPTVYQPSAISQTRSGYSETQIDVNRLRVMFAGENGTERETVESSLLYRAAEITVQRGYDYFVVVDHSVDAKTETIRKGPPLPPIGPKRTEDVTRYTATSEIIMYKGARPAEKPEAYDARTVQTNLQWRIVRR
jgi:hypothetical protein